MASSIGASVDVHFCNDEVYSIGINAPADKCPGYTALELPVNDFAHLDAACCDQFSAYFQSEVERGSDDVAIQYCFYSLEMPFQEEIEVVNYTEPIELCHFYQPPDFEEDFLTLFAIFRI